jgi:hypothetical protein
VPQEDHPLLGPAREPSWAEEICPLDPRDGPVPWEDLFLAVPLEPVPVRDSLEEFRVQGDPLTTAPPLALLRLGEHGRWRLPPARSR